MSHEIDTTAGQAAIAYVGQEPWHGLGQRLEPGRTIEEWKAAAGLAHRVLETPVEFAGLDGQRMKFEPRKVLYRSDTGAGLSVVGHRYKVVQPGEVLEFFRDLVHAGGYELETAGSLHEGRQVWALARIGEGADIIGNDRVLPYLLLSTSYDGELATVAKATAVRVVCRNTINMALRNGDKHQAAQVNVAHRLRFDAEAVKRELGISVTAWQTFMADAKVLANKELTRHSAEELTYDLIEPTLSVKKGQPLPDVRQSKPYRRILDLFAGDALGSELTGGPTAWQWLNAITQMVDHERGRTADSRMASAWFGAGNALKSRAMELALSA